MSRSYKKYPVYKDSSESCNKYAKRMANKKVRKYLFSLSGKSNDYKKVSESWHICDYRFWKSPETFMKDSDAHSMSKERILQKWKKYYLRK